MSLILCPECGTKISSKAVVCPHCGYVSEDPALPISAQESYEWMPSFEYDIAEWNPCDGSLSVYSQEDNRNLVQFFGDWRRIQTTMPAICEAIQAIAHRETMLVADMDSYVKELIKRGVYRFTISKKGEILPTIRDSGGIVKQVRLKKIEIAPDVIQSFNHLQTQATMAQILSEIEYVGDAIREIHIELQNDRIAMAESTRDKLLQAHKIQDAKLREIALLNVIQSATDAKRVLMRNFARNLQYVEEHSDKSFAQMLIDFKGQHDIDAKSADAFQALISITNAVQIECEGYAMLGEYEAAKECLMQFQSFISENELGNRDTLLLLNSNSRQKQARVVDEFSWIASRIAGFDGTKVIERKDIEMLGKGKDIENESEE